MEAIVSSPTVSMSYNAWGFVQYEFKPDADRCGINSCLRQRTLQNVGRHVDFDSLRVNYKKKGDQSN